MNAKGKGRLGWSASGAELGRWMGMPANGEDSISLFLPLLFILFFFHNCSQDSGYPNPSNPGKIGDSGPFPQIRYHSETDKLYYRPCGC